MEKNTIIITHNENHRVTCNSDDYIYTAHGVKSGYFYTKDALIELTQMSPLMEKALADITKQIKNIANSLPTI